MTRRGVLAGLAVAAVIGALLVEVTRTPAPGVDPVAASSFLDPATISRAEAYRIPLRYAVVLSMVLRVGAAVAVAVVAARWTARRPQGRWDRPRLRPLRLGLAGGLLWAATDLVRLPLQAWAWHRSVEAGLSTLSLHGWLGEVALQSVPYWAGVGVAVGCVVWGRARWPRTWVPVVGLTGGLVGVVLIVISPLLFEPLLFDLSPLPEGPLREDIASLTTRAGLDPDTPVLVADASRRTTASNAYVSGIGATRRIVLYDTLLADAPDEEVLMVLAHELGHRANADVERTAVQLVGVTVLLVWLVARLAGPGVAGSDGQVTAAGVTRMVAVAIILLVVLGPVERWSSRRTESAADVAALQLTGDPATYQRMMQGLATRNLSDPDPPGWTVLLSYSHPPTGERYARGTSSQ